MTTKQILLTAILLTTSLRTFSQDEIAFITRRINGTSDWLIYLMDTNGMYQRRLLDDIVSCSPIYGTRTGDKIAFFIVKQGLYTINKDGENLKFISKLGTNPAWSYDGEKLLYAERDGEQSDIFLYNFLTDTHTKITDDGHSHSPSWFPDNNKFIFASTKDNSCKIYKMAIDGNYKKQISPNENCFCNPSVSPIGDKIAIVLSDWNGSQIYVIDSSGSNLIQLTNSVNTHHWDSGFPVEGNSDPVWSPDGSKIAYVTWEDGNPDICIINPDGTHKKKLTTDEDRDENPNWSYDGNYIIFESTSYQVFRMKADGTEKINLSNYRGYNGRPIWIKN